MNTGKAIQKALIDAEMNQQDLANKMGCSRQKINKLCNRADASTLVLDDIAKALNITINELWALG